jgi:hypothetical protein
MSGSLVPVGFGGRPGTGAPLMLQTHVNEQPKSKHFRGDSRADASRSARTVTPTKRPASRQQSAKPNRCSAAPDPRFHPARGLMICLDGCASFEQLSRTASLREEVPFPMKHDAVLAARPALIFFSPRKSAIPRRLRITLWQTHSWIKKIVKLRSARRPGRKLKPCAKGASSLHRYVSFAHQGHHAHRRRSNGPLVLRGPFGFA